MIENLSFGMKLKLLVPTCMRAWGLVHTSHIVRLSIFGLAMLLLGFPVYATNEYLLASDREGRNILRYDAETGAFVDVLVSAGSGNMNVPFGMAIGPDGDLYVSSGFTEIFPTHEARVLKFDSETGKFLGTFGTASTTSSLGFMAFGPDGNLYVGDVSNATVLRFDGKTGESMGVFATGLPGEGYFGLDWGPDGNLYVGSFQDHIDRFDGVTGASLGILSTPEASSAGSVTFGPDGMLYVSDYFGSQVLVYDIVTGELVKSLHQGLSGPNSVVFTEDGDLLVASYFNNRIVKFEAESSTGTIFAGGHPLNGPRGLLLVPALPVPEPSTYVMLLAGLGLLGFVAHHRKTITI